jgi:hypothetical protein
MALFSRENRNQAKQHAAALPPHDHVRLDNPSGFFKINTGFPTCTGGLREVCHPKLSKGNHGPSRKCRSTFQQPPMHLLR